jgi:hypothetical protein
MLLAWTTVDAYMRGLWISSSCLLAALLLGCAPAATVTMRVPEASYLRLPEKVRQGAEAKESAELSRARSELERASQELDAEQHEVAAGPAEQRAAQEALNRARAELSQAPPDRQEQARLDLETAEAGLRVGDAKQGWLIARQSWRKQVVEVAKLHVVTADAAVELARARALSRYDDSVEVERYRGQHGRLHQRWSEGQARVRLARQEVDRLEAPLVVAKLRYAELKSVVLRPPVVSPPVVVIPPVVVRPATPPPGPQPE